MLDVWGQSPGQELPKRQKERAVTVGDGRELKERVGRPMGFKGIVGTAVAKATRKGSARTQREPKVKEKVLIC